MYIQGRIIHEAGEAEASGPGTQKGTWTAQYNENLQSRTTLGPEICGLLIFLPQMGPGPEGSAVAFIPQGPEGA